MMMKRIAMVAFLSLAVAAASLGQTQDSDSQTLLRILAELRAIHDDMRVTETTQLLVAELETQQGVVNRATENADNARSRLNGNRLDQKLLAADLNHAEDQLEKAASADEREALAQAIDQRKSNLAALKTAERDFSANLQEMEQRLQDAQDKLENIEAELNAAMSRLSPSPKDAGKK
jgi:chromosome segregation ATPase